MKILVTGGAGYVGSHVCKALATQGHEPIVYDNLSHGHRWAVKWGPLEEGDIADIQRVRAVLEKYRPAALMHFAALINVAESVLNPDLYYKNNVAGSRAFLETVISTEPIPVIFSSTAAVYGNPTTIPIAEDHPTVPINPYGNTKLEIEKLLSSLDKVHGLRSVCLRYFNAAGADHKTEIGEDHNPETHLIPLVLAAAKRGTAVRIFGNDYETPDGTCIRDYVHVMDIADAHVAALKYLLAGHVSCVCNLANSRGHSVAEVIKVAEKVCARSIRTDIAPRRAGDPPILIGVANRAKKLLGWFPQCSDLEMQIIDAWNWLNRQ